MNSDDLETISWKPRIEAVQQRCGMLLRAACCALLIMSSLCEFALAAPETASTTNTQDEQSCAALTALNLQAVPVRITWKSSLRFPPVSVD